VGGESNRRDHIRLYRDIALNEFWDLPEDRVRHIRELAPTGSRPFGLNVVWVDVSAEPDTDEPVVYWRSGAQSDELPLSEIEQTWRGGDGSGQGEVIDRVDLAPPLPGPVPEDEGGLIPVRGNIPVAPTHTPRNGGRGRRR
jgi:hypothetical protein